MRQQGQREAESKTVHEGNELKYRREPILRSIRIFNSRTLTGDMVIPLHGSPSRVARQGIRPAAPERLAVNRDKFRMTSKARPQFVRLHTYNRLSLQRRRDTDFPQHAYA